MTALESNEDKILADRLMVLKQFNETQKENDEFHLITDTGEKEDKILAERLALLKQFNQSQIPNKCSTEDQNYVLPNEVPVKMEDNMEDSVIWTSAMFFSKDFMRVLGLIKDIMGGLKNKILIRDQEGRQNEIFFCIWFMFYINVWRSQNS